VPLRLRGYTHDQCQYVTKCEIRSIATGARGRLSGLLGDKLVGQSCRLPTIREVGVGRAKSGRVAESGEELVAGRKR
jgi:hypothetical protein